MSRWLLCANGMDAVNVDYVVKIVVDPVLDPPVDEEERTYQVHALLRDGSEVRLDEFVAEDGGSALLEYLASLDDEPRAPEDQTGVFRDRPPKTSDEWLAEAERIERWSDEMRADLDANVIPGTYANWTAWDMLQAAGGRLRTVAAYIAIQEQDG